MPKNSTSRPVAALLPWLLLLVPATLSASCGRPPQEGKAGAETPQAVAAGPSPIPWKTIEPPRQVFAPGGAAQSPRPAVVKTYSGIGVVTKVDHETGSVEINHEEIKGLMPPMVMEWYVRNRALMMSVRVGDRVAFEVEDSNGSEVITGLKKAPR